MVVEGMRIKMAFEKIFCFFINYCVISGILCFASGTEDDYCNGDTFNPQCSDGEIVIMQSAQYGRMRENKCFPTDFGYVGCKTDVLTQFDKECSGKPRCEVFITDRNIEAKGGCMKGLVVYLQASYICKKELEINHHCSTNQLATVEITSSQSYLSSDELKTCTQQNKPLRLKAGDGQKFNITMINLQHESISDSVFGFIKDTITNKRILFGEGPRYQHLLISDSNVVEIGTQANAHHDARFLFQIEVHGCPNLNPPEGAWMTRQDDVMEIGCHSGSKSWTLTCEKNQWIGAVGQCGYVQGSQVMDEEIEKIETGGLSIRMHSVNAAYETAARGELHRNGTKSYIARDSSWVRSLLWYTRGSVLHVDVMLFGICSVIILISSIIFLLGVCILKRKLRQTPVYSLPPNQTDTVFIPPYPGDQLVNVNQDTIFKPIPNNTAIPVTQQRTLEPGYKSLQTREGDQNAPNVTGSVYMNGSASDASDSVKYYILDDVACRT